MWKIPARSEEKMLWASLGAAPLFIGGLLVFGALTPGYSHLHRSVSELGALHTQWGLWFDLTGLFIPGILQAGVAWELRHRLRMAGAKSFWATGLFGFSLMFALTAVPADFQRKFASPWTWAHAVFALGSLPVLLVVVYGCARGLRALGASRRAAGIFCALGYLPVVEFLLYGPMGETPGLVQRLMILTVHAVFAWLALALLKANRTE
jgi:hypothetical protein